MELVKIENKELQVKEWNSERVLTVWDIAELHERKVNKTNELLKNNLKHFIKNVDFYLLTRNEFLETFKSFQKKIPNNVKFIPLFTESGYLKLVKPMTDDLSWKIQGVLIKSYFKIKELQQNEFKVPKTFKEALLLAVEQQEEIERLELENKEKQELIEIQKPKADFYDTVTTSNDTIDFKQVAKVLNYKNIGRNTLMKFLRDKGVLNYRNEPYQKYVNLGYFKSIETKFIDNFGNVRINVKTVVFQKGVDFINKLLDKEYENI